METRRLICRSCGAYLIVPVEVQSVDCPVCDSTNHVNIAPKMGHQYTSALSSGHHYGGFYHEPLQTSTYMVHSPGGYNQQPPVHIIGSYYQPQVLPATAAAYYQQPQVPTISAPYQRQMSPETSAAYQQPRVSPKTPSPYQQPQVSAKKSAANQPPRVKGANRSYQQPQVSPPLQHGSAYPQKQPSQISMQVSPPQLQGSKRAVLCGVTYKGHPQELEDSLNNVRSMQRLLVDRAGFPNASVLVLTEEESDASRIPTKHNIQMALRWLIQDCQSGDSLFFYYSGYGSQVPDIDGDEIDGYDESLCPVDYKTAGHILDDEINATIVKPLRRGAKLHSITDTCYSGTLLDLPYLCRMSEEGYYTWEDHRISYHAAYKGTSGGRALCFSACDDQRHSGDAMAFTGHATGALTYSFVQAVENERNLTYWSLLMAMRKKVREAQEVIGLNARSLEPQLSSSESFIISSERFTL